MRIALLTYSNSRQYGDMETPMKTLPNLLLTRLHSEHSEQSQGPATPYTEDVPEIINVEEDTGSEEEDEPET